MQRAPLHTSIVGGGSLLARDGRRAGSAGDGGAAAAAGAGGGRRCQCARGGDARRCRCVRAFDCVCLWFLVLLLKLACSPVHFCLSRCAVSYGPCDKPKCPGSWSMLPLPYTCDCLKPNEHPDCRCGARTSMPAAA